MENKKNNTNNKKNISEIKITKSETTLVPIAKEVLLVLSKDVAAKATIFGVRYSKGKTHYDLNVITDKGVIPFYNIDSVLVKF